MDCIKKGDTVTYTKGGITLEGKVVEVVNDTAIVCKCVSFFGKTVNVSPTPVPVSQLTKIS